MHFACSQTNFGNSYSNLFWVVKIAFLKWFTSSSVDGTLPRNPFLIFVKAKKSLWLRSGLYGGRFVALKNLIVLRAMCELALTSVGFSKVSAAFLQINGFIPIDGNSSLISQRQLLRMIFVDFSSSWNTQTQNTFIFEFIRVNPRYINDIAVYVFRVFYVNAV